MTDLIVVQRSPTLLLADGPAVPVPHGTTHKPGQTDEIADSRANIRRQRLLTAMGLITETCPRGQFATSAAGISQQVVGNPVYMFAGETFTSIPINCASAGASENFFEVLVYSLDNALRARSGDVKATFTSTGEKDVPMVTPYLVPADGVYWLMFLGVGGTTPGVSRGAGGPGAGVGGGPYSGAQIGVGAQMTGQVTVPTTLVPTGSNVMFWMGVR